ETERVVVGDHPAASVGQDPALGGTAAEGFDDLLDVEPGLYRENDSFGDAEVGSRQDHLVDCLHRLAGPARANVGDGRAEGLADRARPLDGRRLSANEDGEGRHLSALRAT